MLWPSSPSIDLDQIQTISKSSYKNDCRLEKVLRCGSRIEGWVISCSDTNLGLIDRVSDRAPRHVRCLNCALKAQRTAARAIASTSRLSTKQLTDSKSISTSDLCMTKQSNQQYSLDAYGNSSGAIVEDTAYGQPTFMNSAVTMQSNWPNSVRLAYLSSRTESIIKFPTGSPDGKPTPLPLLPDLVFHLKLREASRKIGGEIDQL